MTYLQLPNPSSLEDWKHSKEAFALRFGVTYDDFGDVVMGLSPEKRHEYEGLLLRNERVAILWAIDEGVAMGFVRHHHTG